MLRLHKLRAFLTMLGVIIGVMSVSLIVMLSEGFQAYIDTEFKKLGADTIFIFYDMGRRMRGQTTGGVEGLTNDDIGYILAKSKTVEIASGYNQVPGQSVRFGEEEVPDAELSAIDENFLELNRFTILTGRSFTRADVVNRQNICLIGEEIRDRLFKKENPIGKRVSLKGISLEVVGVLEKVEFMGNSTAKDIMVPLSTVQDKWMGGENLMLIMMRPKPGITVDATMDEVWEVMMQKSNNRPIYRIDSRESILNVFAGVIGVAGVVLGAIAALSLLVGGIGIMNIMLVSVTERTREIGLRKAVGAKRPAVLLQFLVEAAVLSVAGGLIGMGIAYVLGQAVHLITKQMGMLGGNGFMISFPLWAAIGAILFSAAVGMVFGLYPAWSAAKLDPIVALRSE
jgi:putative ABC transport system permease protein